MRNWLRMVLRRPRVHHLDVGDLVEFRGAACIITSIDMSVNRWGGPRVTFNAVPAIEREVNDHG